MTQASLNVHECLQLLTFQLFASIIFHMHFRCCISLGKGNRLAGGCKGAKELGISKFVFTEGAFGATGLTSELALKGQVSESLRA